MQHDIFLSYSRKDTHTMQRVKSSFATAGLSVWTDKGIELGTSSWRRKLQEAIISSSCMVCLMSPDSRDSEWVQEELDFARVQKKTVFPIFVRGEENNAVPFGFSRAQWIDIRDESRYDSEIEKLIGTIKEHYMIVPPTAGDLLPAPFEWCEIPGGKVHYDSNTAEFVTDFVEDFWIAKYPVTNLQFQSFLSETDGYSNPRLWDKLPELSQHWFKHIRRQSPPNFSGDWCPRENVNWHEAMAFCSWLSGRLDLNIALPTQSQRICAVRGTKGFEYPWGMEFDSTRCNTRENMIERTTSVTKYPGGSSAYGLMDLSGNVWEWSRTGHKDESGNIIGYYMYGGGWRGRRRHTIADFPRCQRPEYRASDVGFRICAAP